MFERVLRLALVGITFAILFLPYQGDTGESVLGISYWYSMEILAVLFGSILNTILGTVMLLFFLTLPMLILLNTFLMIFPSQGFRKLYRIFLLVFIFPLKWLITFIDLSEGSWGIGFWASLAVVTAATLMEITFMISERRKKSEGASPVVE